MAGRSGYSAHNTRSNSCKATVLVVKMVMTLHTRIWYTTMGTVQHSNTHMQQHQHKPYTQGNQ